MWTDDYLDFVRRIAPGADVRVWEGASHLLHLERATEFRGLLADFVGRTCAPCETPDSGGGNG